MKITVNLDGLKMGNNQLTESFTTGDFGLRIEIQNEDDKQRSTFHLNFNESLKLIDGINAAWAGRNKIMENMGRAI